LLDPQALVFNKCTSPNVCGLGDTILGLVVKYVGNTVADRVYTVGVEKAGPINADTVITYVYVEAPEEGGTVYVTLAKLLVKSLVNVTVLSGNE